MLFKQTSTMAQLWAESGWCAHAGIQVYPRLINIGPQVNIGYPATPPPAKKAGATPGAKNGAQAAPVGESFAVLHPCAAHTMCMGTACTCHMCRDAPCCRVHDTCIVLCSNTNAVVVRADGQCKSTRRERCNFSCRCWPGYNPGLQYCCGQIEQRGHAPCFGFEVSVSLSSL